MRVMAAAVPAIGACGDNKLGPSTPASVSIVSGDTQSILVGDQASQPLIVGINNSDGSPLANIPVTWAVISGGGSLQPVTDTTDVNGQARAMYLSPAIAGTAKVTAAAARQVGTFTLIVAADTVGSISAFAGDGSAALVGFQLTLIAKATDRFGNAIPGVALSWSASSGILQLPSNATTPRARRRTSSRSDPTPGESRSVPAPGSTQSRSR